MYPGPGGGDGGDGGGLGGSGGGDGDGDSADEDDEEEAAGTRGGCGGGGGGEDDPYAYSKMYADPELEATSSSFLAPTTTTPSERARSLPNSSPAAASVAVSFTVSVHDPASFSKMYPEPEFEPVSSFLFFK